MTPLTEAKLFVNMQLYHLITLSSSILNALPCTAVLFIKVESVIMVVVCLVPALMTAPSWYDTTCINDQLLISSCPPSLTFINELYWSLILLNTVSLI